MIENTDTWSSTSCINAVTIKINDTDKAVIISLGKGHQIKVNGQQINELPVYILGDYALISRPSSTKTSVLFKNGWRVFWDGKKALQIDITSVYSGDLNGLCVSPKSLYTRTKRSTATDTQDWIISIVKTSCYGESCQNIEKAVNIPHPCEANANVKKEAEKHCAKIKTTFKTCHEKIAYETYYRDCVYDVCAFNGNIHLGLCPAFEAYANECSQHGRVDNWRQSVHECGETHLVHSDLTNENDNKILQQSNVRSGKCTWNVQLNAIEAVSTRS